MDLNFTATDLKDKDIKQSRQYKSIKMAILQRHNRGMHGCVLMPEDDKYLTSIEEEALEAVQSEGFKVRIKKHTYGDIVFITWVD